MFNPTRIDLASIKGNLSLHCPTATSTTGLSTTSSSYYLWINSGKEPVKEGIYKPRLQVIGAVDHPTKSTSGSARKGIPAGTEAFRERLAYALSEELDQNLRHYPQLIGTFGIPTTIICDIQHELFGGNHKSGSLQKYVTGQVSLDSLDSPILNRIPLNELYKTAIIDLIFLNTDRHLGNLLYSTATQQISLIDHGGCFPGLQSLKELHFGWNYIDFTKEPIPPEWVSFVGNINTKKLAERVIREVSLHAAEFPSEEMEISGEALFAMIYAIESLKSFTQLTPQLPLIEYTVHMVKESRRFGIIKDCANQQFEKVIEEDLAINNQVFEQRLRDAFPSHDVTVERKDVGGEFSRKVQNAFATIFPKAKTPVTAHHIWEHFDRIHSFITQDVSRTPITPYHELLLKKLNNT